MASWVPVMKGSESRTVERPTGETAGRYPEERLNRTRNTPRNGTGLPSQTEKTANLMTRRGSERRVPTVLLSRRRSAKQVSLLADRKAKRVRPLAYRLLVTIKLDWSLAMRRARPLESSLPSHKYC